MAAHTHAKKRFFCSEKEKKTRQLRETLFQAQQLEEREKELKRRDLLHKENIARLEAKVGEGSFTNASYICFLEIYLLSFFCEKIIL